MPIPDDKLVTLDSVTAITIEDGRSFLVNTGDELKAVKAYNRVALDYPELELPRVRRKRCSPVAAIEC